MRGELKAEERKRRKIKRGWIKIYMMGLQFGREEEEMIICCMQIGMRNDYFIFGRMVTLHIKKTN